LGSSSAILAATAADATDTASKLPVKELAPSPDINVVKIDTS